MKLQRLRQWADMAMELNAMDAKKWGKSVASND